MRRHLVIFAVVLTSSCGVPVPEGQAGGPAASGLRLAPAGVDAVRTQLPAQVSVRFTADLYPASPVTGLGAGHLKLTEDGTPVSPRESQLRLTPQSEGYRIASLLLLDVSGSILRSGEFDALVDAARQYARQVLAQGGGAQQVAVATFDGRERPQLVVGFTGQLAQVEAGLDALRVSECKVQADCAPYADRRACAGFRCVDDSTNLYGAVTQGLGLLSAALATPTDARHQDGALVLFTDGADQASRVPKADALAAVDGTPLHVFTVGLGPEADRLTLATLGRDGTFAVDAPGALGDAFAQIADRVSALAHRTYQLDYCSPRRSGRHTLEVLASVPTGAGEVRGSLTVEFNAEGFQSGCQL